MRVINDMIYSGPDNEEIINQIDSEIFSCLLDDYIFIQYHDIERGILVHRELNNPDKDSFKELLKDKDDLFAWYKAGINAYVHIDDQAGALEIVNPDNHSKLLEDRKKVTRYIRWNNSGSCYRYCRLELIKLENENEEPVRVLLTAVKADEEVNLRFGSENDKKLQLSNGDNLSGIYHTLLLIRPDKTMELFRIANQSRLVLSEERIFNDVKDYDQGMQMYADMFVAPEDADRFEESLRYDSLVERVPEDGIYTVTFRRIYEHGQLLYLQVCVSRAVGADGKLNFVFVLREVDDFIREERKRREEYQKAINERDIDALTGLRNRFCYERKIKSYDKIEHKSIACIFIDADGLRELNNTKGHCEGDELIKCVGKNILKYWGRDDTFRIGGDEFVVFDFDIDEKSLFVTIEQFRESIHKAGYSTSIGWAIKNVRNLETVEMLKEAERAMFEEKRRHYSGNNDRRGR